MASFKAGGFGQEFYGDPMGGGGPLHVQRARAVGSHTIRVAFNIEPLHKSPAGRQDALNPANYSIGVTSGQVIDPATGQQTTPQSVGVDRGLLTAPSSGLVFGVLLDVTNATNAAPVVITTSVAHGLLAGARVRVSGVTGNLAANGEFNATVLTTTTFSLDGSVGNGAYVSGGKVYGIDERGVDVHTDRALVLGISYRVTVTNVVSRTGGALGSPTFADFVGVQPVGKVRPPRQPRGLVDIANEIVTGGWTVDGSGDLAPDTGGVDSLRKRVIRRLTTGKGAFSFLPDYGVGLKMKEPAGPADVVALKADVLQQVSREPEVAQVSASLSLLQTGTMTVKLNIRTRAGATVTMSGTRKPDGTVAF